MEHPVARLSDHLETRVAQPAPAAPAPPRRVPGTWVQGGSALILLSLAVLLGLALVVASGYGAVAIEPATTLRILLNQTGLFHFTATWPLSDEAILLLYRLPRVAGAALVGAALAGSGVLFQGLLRNPLADPLLLGTSAGAGLGATLAFLLPVSFTAVALGFGLVAACAFAGALLAVMLVYALSVRRDGTPVVTLLLAGVAVSAMLTAVQTLIITMSDRIGLRLISLYRWLSGGLDVRSWEQLAVIAALIVAGLALSLFQAPALDTFAAGEEMAGVLGINVERSKLALVGAASLLVAAAVSISGLVGFVGLIAPHLCRLVFGPRHRLLVPASALAGATFVVVADLLARTLVAPGELPLGVLTALVGGPFFLWLLRSAGRRYRW